MRERDNAVLMPGSRVARACPVLNSGDGIDARHGFRGTAALKIGDGRYQPDCYEIGRKSVYLETQMASGTSLLAAYI
jgi:hypothetical protein